MNKIDRDAEWHCWDMFEGGDMRSNKEIEKDASWKALHDQIPKMPRQEFRKEKEALKVQEAEANLIAEQKDILGRYFKDESGNVHFYYKVIGVVNDNAIVEVFTGNNKYYRKYTSNATITIKLLTSYKEITKAEYDEMKENTVCKLNYNSIFELPFLAWLQ